LKIQKFCWRRCRGRAPWRLSFVFSFLEGSSSSLGERETERVMGEGIVVLRWVQVTRLGLHDRVEEVYMKEGRMGIDADNQEISYAKDSLLIDRAAK
jgi:hypothetical protein